jgi:hypothetical protein
MLSFLFLLTLPAHAAIDWAQPPVACVEELLPEKPDRPCLDLSQVKDPQKDWPELSEEELRYWKSRKRPIQYCRAEEIFRREKLAPGSFSGAVLEVSWMQLKAVENRETKVSAVYAASRKHGVPAQVLVGAFYQESIYAELGIAADGDNYSCGVGQVNILEWCRWANAQSAAKKTEMNWPSAVDCASLSTSLVKPFYEIAKTRLAGEKEYKLNKSHFANIRLEEVNFPAAPPAVQRLRFQSVTSFVQNCSDAQNGIAAKAHELAAIYRQFVPAGLKARENYREGESFQRSCREQGAVKQYPLHMGWLLAVGAYNAGPRAVDAFAYYHGWSREEMKSPATFSASTPLDMVEAFYWGGKYQRETDKIHFTTLSGAESSWNWFKPCVLQRHIARVAQHATLPGVPSYIDTLEGAEKCAKSTYDSEGRLIKSGVPLLRQQSSGKR